MTNARSVLPKASVVTAPISDADLARLREWVGKPEPWPWPCEGADNAYNQNITVAVTSHLLLPALLARLDRAEGACRENGITFSEEEYSPVVDAIHRASFAAANLIYDFAAKVRDRAEYQPIEALAQEVQGKVVITFCDTVRAARKPAPESEA